MHCHNVPHMIQGMMIALEEASDLIPHVVARYEEYIQI